MPARRAGTAFRDMLAAMRPTDPPADLTAVMPFDQHRGRLLALARRLLGRGGEAEDVLQDAWLRWQAQADAPRNAEAWLMTVVRHFAIDRRRAQALHAERLALLPPHGAAPAAEDAVLERASVQAALARLAERLAPEEAALVLLHEVFELDHGEISAAWGRAEPACRQALRRALRRLHDAGTPPRRADAADEAALLAVCLRAFAGRSAAPLLSLLREAAVRAAAGGAAAPASSPAARRPVADAATVRLPGGALGHALRVDGVVVCVLPLGVLDAQADDQAAGMLT